MNITVAEIMRSPVMTVTKHQTCGHAATLMVTKRVSALPVVGPGDEPIGMVTASDLIERHADSTPVSSFMSKDPLTVPVNEGPHVAARIMRNHHIHHVIVVDDHRVVGMVSAYDLLRLVEDHRFQMKQAPTPPSRKKPTRQ